MKITNHIRINRDDAARLSFGSNCRWLDIGSKDGTEVTIFFPDGVPDAAIKAIEDSFNDALEMARASFEAKVEAQMKVVWGERHEQKEVA